VAHGSGMVLHHVPNERVTSTLSHVSDHTKPQSLSVKKAKLPGE
jgi:hypothetical protein